MAQEEFPIHEANSEDSSETNTETGEPHGAAETVEGVPTGTDVFQSPQTTEPIKTTGVIDDSDELNEHVDDPGDPDGVVAAEQRQRWEDARPTPVAAYKPKRLWPKLLITVVVIAAAAYGAYWIGNHEATKSQAPIKKQKTVKQSQQAQTNVSQTVSYNSTNYGLSFNYLKGWTVSDTTTKLTVTSPAMSLSMVNGAKSNVHVVVTIQNPIKTIPGYPTSDAVAALESQDISYTQPTGAQSAQSYVSYVGYTSTSGIDAIYITGNSGYQQGQIVPMSDITQVNPFVGIQFETCSDDTCTNGKVVTISANKWESSTASKDVINLIESLEIQD